MKKPDTDLKSGVFQIHLPLLALTIIGVGIAIGGIFFAIFITKVDNHGYRGGVIAVAISFLLLFLVRNDTSVIKDFYKISAEISRILNLRASPTEQAINELKQSLQSNTDQIDHLQKNQTRLNIYLAVISVVGTLVAGFGDIIAKQFIP